MRKMTKHASLERISHDDRECLVVDGDGNEHRAQVVYGEDGATVVGLTVYTTGGNILGGLPASDAKFDETDGKWKTKKKVV